MLDARALVRCAATAAFCAVVASGQRSHVSAPECPDPWVNANAVGLGCLLFDHTTRSGWQQSQEYCSGLGGRLVEWDSSAQYDFLNARLVETFFVNGVNRWWIGAAGTANDDAPENATENATEGMWAWASSSQELPDDFPWGWNQPEDDSYSNCVALQDNWQMEPSFTGDDARCTSYLPHICQRPMQHA